MLASTNSGFSMSGDNLHDKDILFQFQNGCQNATYVLGRQFLEWAYNRNRDLKSSDPVCFTPAFIKNQQKASQKLKDLGGIPLTVPGGLSPDVHCTFFDRNSDKLLILGSGFPVQRERMLPFVKLFPSYDLVLFDYRGIGADYQPDKLSLLYPWKWKGFISWVISKVDFNISGVGTLEEDDVIAVLDTCKQRKNYRQVFGLALCFSSYVFSRAAAKRPDLFDKLIFDGSWPSLERVAKSIVKEPSLLCSVENPHSPVPCITQRQCVQSFVMGLLEWIAWVDLHALPTSFYFSKLRCPVLFIQCLNDCYCNAEEFEKLWDVVETPKAAVFTDNLHGRNHVWQAEACKEITNAFLDHSFNDFVNLVKLQQ